MASLIQSLTQHFDRCGLALKGSESDMQVDPDLFLVLSRDAAQVDDVVAELKEILEEMEDISVGIDAKLGELRRFEDGIISILVAFEDHQIELAAYLDGLRMFENRQKELKYDMEARLEELKAFREFYDGFRGAYDAMVVEVGRRQGVQVRMENIVKEAMRQVKELYDGMYLWDRMDCRALRGLCLVVWSWTDADIYNRGSSETRNIPRRQL
jgi:autophagy-related protein 17